MHFINTFRQIGYQKMERIDLRRTHTDRVVSVVDFRRSQPAGCNIAEIGTERITDNTFSCVRNTVLSWVRLWQVRTKLCVLGIQDSLLIIIPIALFLPK